MAAEGPFVLSPDGRLLAGRKAAPANAKAKAGTIVIWEMASGKEVSSVTTKGFGKIALTPDNRCVVTTEYGILKVRDLATGAVRQSLPMPDGDVGSRGRTWVWAMMLSPDAHRAITAIADGTALVWDLTPSVRPAEPLVKTVGTKELTEWWSDLASHDAAKARRAIWSLTDAPDRAVSFLADRLKPMAPPDEKQVRRWIANLDSDDFTTREAAHAALARLGELVEPARQQALKGQLPVETRRRLDRLGQVAQPALGSEGLRSVRAVEVLEVIGTRKARGVLQGLAKGAAGARQTREARQALERLAKRAVRAR